MHEMCDCILAKGTLDIVIGGAHSLNMKKISRAAGTALQPESLSLGTRLAEKTRAVANALSDDERERLLHRGLQLIYAERRDKKPAHRR